LVRKVQGVCRVQNLASTGRAMTGRRLIEDLGECICVLRNASISAIGKTFQLMQSMHQVALIICLRHRAMRRRKWC